MRPTSSLLRVAAAAAAMSAPALAQPAIHDVGVLPGAASSGASGLSATGMTVVGLSGGHVFRWTVDGGFEDLGAVPALVSMSVSADGSALAGTSTTTGAVRAVRWTQSGGEQSIHPSGWTLSYGTGISADGSVVVGAIGMSAQDRAFRWTPSGGLQDLGLFNGTYTAAWGVSADGSIVLGEAWAPDGGAVRWSGGVWQSLGRLPGGNNAHAIAVSDDGGVVVGTSGSSSGSRAFRWTQDDGMQSLGVLPGASTSLGRRVSGDGTMVLGLSGSSPFVWTAELGMLDANDYLSLQGVDLTGWVVTDVAGVSADRSAMAGTGLFEGQTRAWLVTGIGQGGPCPADWNDDDVVSSSDISAFLASWLASVTDGTLDADFNLDDQVNSADISAFLAAWLDAVQNGC